MNYSSSALLLAICWCATSATTLSAQDCVLVNAGTNCLTVSGTAGLGRVGPGLTIPWAVTSGEWSTNYVDGVLAGEWLPQRGHEYQVYLNAAGAVAVVDRSVLQTDLFWWGFSMSFCVGMIALGVRWTRSIIGGGGHNEGLNE